MDFIMWSCILLELALSISGVQELDKLVKKAADAFLKKLDCTHVSVLQYQDNHLGVIYAVPRVDIENPIYYELIEEFEKKLLQKENEKIIIIEKNVHYYGFPLKNFGMLLLGRNAPLENVFLKELLPIIDMLAQNCFASLNASIKQQVVEEKLKREHNLLRAIIDAIPDVIFYRDENGVYKLANKAAGKFLSLLPEDPYGSIDWNFSHKGETNTDKASDRGVRESNTVQRCEEWSNGQNSGSVPLETAKVFVYDEEGNYIGTIAVAIDILEKLDAVTKKIQTGKKWLDILFENSTDAIVRIDRSYLIEEINYSFYELFGYNFEEVKGKKLDYILDSEQKNTASKHYLKVLLAGKEVVTEDTCYTKEGLPVEVMVRGFPILIDGELLGAYLLYNDFTKIKHCEKRLKYLTSHDQLTGLYNRRFLEEEINRLDTLQQLPVSIIMGDINELKLINDVFGHQEGDRLLINAAEIIQKSCRSGDFIGRWGGDEFVVLLPQTDIKTAEDISLQIQEKCTFQKSRPIQVSIALGCATKNRAEEDIWQVLKKAEDRMYSNKLSCVKNDSNFIVSSLRNALAEKSMETEEHAERLKVMCRKIGERVGLNLNQLNELELLATLHDIGKVAIEKSILMKSGHLTEDEWVQIKKHPAIGYRIAKAVPELFPIAEYILSHHERWDGKGYPRGLRGEEIPLLSRILAVADAFDAMTSDRIYRKAVSSKEAIAEIKRNAGTQFDPKVVRAFIGKTP